MFLKEEQIPEHLKGYFEKVVLFSHSTVKPLALLEYLCTLTRTPTGGVVLDPFMGTGTTGEACVSIGRPFIGIERAHSSFKIATRRIECAEHQVRQLALI